MRRPNSSFPALLNGDPLPSPGVQAGRCGWSSSPGSAGVPPAPCSCKQPPSHRPARPGRAGPPEPMRPVRRLPSPGVQAGRHGWFRSRRSSSPGSAGVPPAPFSCKQPPIHRQSLAKPTKPAFTGFSSIEVRQVATIVPNLVRAGRPRSQGGIFGRLHCLHRRNGPRNHCRVPDRQGS